MTDENSVIERQPLAAWAVGPGRDTDDGGPAGERDFEIVAVLTTAIDLDSMTQVAAVDLKVPRGNVDETGAVHMLADEAIVIGRQLVEAGRIAQQQVSRQ